MICLVVIDRDRIFSRKFAKNTLHQSESESVKGDSISQSESKKKDQQISGPTSNSNALLSATNAYVSDISPSTTELTTVTPSLTMEMSSSPVLMQIFLDALNESQHQIYSDGVGSLQGRSVADGYVFSNAMENNAITLDEKKTSFTEEPSSTTNTNPDEIIMITPTEHSLQPQPRQPTMNSESELTGQINRITEITGNEFITNSLSAPKDQFEDGIYATTPESEIYKRQPTSEPVNRLRPDKTAMKKQSGGHVRETQKTDTYSQSKLYGNAKKGAAVEATTKKLEKRNKKWMKRMTRFFLCNSPVLIDMLEQIQNEIIDDV